MTVTVLPRPTAAVMESQPTSAGPWVAAAPFRAHVRHLCGAGRLPWRAVATLAGVEPGCVRSLLQGRRGRTLHRIHPWVASRLLGVDLARTRRLRQHTVPAGRVSQLLRHHLDTGVEPATLARWLQLSLPELHDLAERRLRRCSALTQLLADSITTDDPTSGALAA